MSRARSLNTVVVIAAILGLCGAGPVQAQEAVATPEAEISVEFVWEATGGPEPLTFPQHVGIAPDGNLWVGDLANGQFQIFSPGGEYVESWGEAGSGPGQFGFFQGPPVVESDFAGAVQFDSAGNLYVLDMGHRAIHKFAPDRTFLFSFGAEGPGALDKPLGLDLDGQDHVFVSDYGRDEVLEFNSDGEFLGVAVARGAANGQLLAADGLEVDAAGAIWATDEERNAVLHFAPDGRLVASWGGSGSGPGEFQLPNDVAVAADGTVFVVDCFNHRVQIFDASGRFLGMWGEEGSEPGQFSFPLGVTVDDAGNIYVADFGNNRIQKFRLVL